MEQPTSLLMDFKAVVNLIKRKFEEQEIEKDFEGITGMQGYLIAYLYHHQSQNEVVFQRDLEKVFNIRRSTVTRMLQLMEKNRLIVRQPVAEDGRLKKITLTAKSKRLHERISGKILAVEKIVCQDLAPEDIEKFHEVLQQIKKNLGGSGGIQDWLR